jgi:hypothetical protein
MAHKKHVDQVRLSSEELAKLQKAANNVFFFASFVYVIHPLKGKVPFKLFPFQISTLYQFLKHRFNVVLKFRQAGVTELISMFCLWYAMYHPYKTIIIISIKDRVAKKVLRKIKFMYKNLPPYLRTKIVNGKTAEDYGTASEMEFSNGSMISSIPTTEEAGRSEAASLMVIDEAAIVRWAQRIWASAFPILSTGGRAIINSTAYGVGNFFHSLFTESLTKGNPFNPIRLYWRMHPERDEKWYNEQKQILGPRKTAQEIDGDFLTSGNNVFDLADIKDIEEFISDLEEDKAIDYKRSGLLKIYEYPKPDVHYFSAMDVASGRSQDYTAFTIFDAAGDEKLSYKGKIGIDHAEKLAMKWNMKYNRAIFAPESNDIGLGLAVNVQNHGYNNLYYSRSMLRKKGKRRTEEQEIPGWYTTSKNRPVIIAQLEEDVRNGGVTIKDRAFCNEAQTFIYDSRNRPIALNKDKQANDDVLDDQVYTDDSIFAHAIGNHIRKQPYNTGSALPR